MSKGEIARFEQFLLLSQCFLKSRLLQRRQKAFKYDKSEAADFEHILAKSGNMSIQGSIIFYLKELLTI